ncbi:MAG TPA: hypothetical protein DDW73_18035 [Rhizobium sp.]|nr:hypothetical protein [Rhizobium sp.]
MLSLFTAAESIMATSVEKPGIIPCLQRLEYFQGDIIVTMLRPFDVRIQGASNTIACMTKARRKPLRNSCAYLLKCTGQAIVFKRFCR